MGRKKNSIRRRDSFIRVEKDGTWKMDCDINDIRFLAALSDVFFECNQRWGMSYMDIAKLIKKYDLINFIYYKDYLSLAHIGYDGVVDDIEKYIKRVNSNGAV